VSGVPPGRHPNWCKCQGCRNDIARFESRALRGDFTAVAAVLAIAAVIWASLAPLRIWHAAGADGKEHPDAATWIAYGAGGAVIMAALMTLSIRSAAKRAPARVPASIPGALRIATAPEAGPGPPACEHPYAGPLVNRFALAPLGWYCPECDTSLPREFGDLRRPCCGTRPGSPHWYSCPHAARWHELNGQEG